LRIFIVIKNPLPWPGFEPATFGSSGQHTNNYTTKTTNIAYIVDKDATNSSNPNYEDKSYLGQRAV
jgi:hypothetical protein